MFLSFTADLSEWGGATDTRAESDTKVGGATDTGALLGIGTEMTEAAMPVIKAGTFGEWSELLWVFTTSLSCRTLMLVFTLPPPETEKKQDFSGTENFYNNLQYTTTEIPETIFNSSIMMKWPQDTRLFALRSDIIFCPLHFTKQ